MADITIPIPIPVTDDPKHVHNGDRVRWQSTSKCDVDFAHTPFRQAGGPEKIPVPAGGSSNWGVVAGLPNPYPYSIAFGATASDPSIIVDP